MWAANVHACVPLEARLSEAFFFTAVFVYFAWLLLPLWLRGFGTLCMSYLVQQQQQGAPEDLRTATIADVIRGRKLAVPSGDVVEGGGGGGDSAGGDGVDERSAWGAAFEVTAALDENP